MPLYLIERRYAEQLDITDEKIRLIEEANEVEGVDWLYSFLTADRRQTYCLYQASSPDAITAAAQRANIPADVIREVSRVSADSY